MLLVQPDSLLSVTNRRLCVRCVKTSHVSAGVCLRLTDSSKTSANRHRHASDESLIFPGLILIGVEGRLLPIVRNPLGRYRDSRWSVVELAEGPFLSLLKVIRLAL